MTRDELIALTAKYPDDWWDEHLPHYYEEMAKANLYLRAGCDFVYEGQLEDRRQVHQVRIWHPTYKSIVNGWAPEEQTYYVLPV